MKNEEEKHLALRTGPLKFKAIIWRWHGLTLFWAAPTEVNNILLVPFVTINWLKKPHWEWDDSFTFVEEKEPSVDQGRPGSSS